MERRGRRESQRLVVEREGENLLEEEEGERE